MLRGTARRRFRLSAIVFLVPGMISPIRSRTLPSAISRTLAEWWLRPWPDLLSLISSYCVDPIVRERRPPSESNGGPGWAPPETLRGLWRWPATPRSCGVECRVQRLSRSGAARPPDA